MTTIGFLRTLETLHRVQKQLWPAICQVYESASPPNSHCFEPGDEVCIKRYNHKTLEPHWKGPHTMILTTPTSVKIDEIRTRIYHSHVNVAMVDKLGAPLLSVYPQRVIQQPCHQVHSGWQEGQLYCWLLTPFVPDLTQNYWLPNRDSALEIRYSKPIATSGTTL